jgi:hypothetical protein
MQHSKLGRITIGMAGATGTSGFGLAACRIASHGGAAEAWVVLTASFVTTGLVATLGLILNYRLGKLALQAQAASARHGADLRRMRLEIQRSILDRIQEGTKGAKAYRTMATADALYLSVEQQVTMASTTDRPPGRDISAKPGSPSSRPYTSSADATS